MRWFQGPFDIDFIGRMRVCLGASALGIFLSVVAIAVLGINFGTDFSGGYEIQMKFPRAVGESEIREVLRGMQLPEARVQRFGAVEENAYLILVREHGTIDEVLREQLKVSFEELAGADSELTNWAVAESGEVIMVGFAQPVGERDVKQIIGKHGLSIKDIRRGEREDRPEYTIEIVSLADHVERALRDKLQLPQDVQVVERMEFVGPQVGAQLRNQGIMAVVYALLFILLYVAVRFDLYFSPGAVVALIHDVIITLGVFAVFQLEFNLPTVASILALVGYSLNDTIVVYDRIRENGVRLRGRELRGMVNSSINETLTRTVLTSGTTLMVVVALWALGGASIRDFAIALFVGIVVGTYSSVAIASPVYVLLREYHGRKPSADRRVVAA